MRTGSEQEIRSLYDRYIHCYSNRDYEGVELLYDINLSAIGGGTNYVMCTKEHLLSEISKDFTQVPDAITIDTTFYNSQLIGSDAGIVTAITSWVVPIGDSEWKDTVRLVFFVSKREAEWKINHISISVSMAALEGQEHFPLKEMEERNRVLQELVEQRSAELKSKEESERRLIEERAALEVANANKQRDILELELQNMRLDLQYKEQELANYALNLASKNECLGQIESSLRQIRSKSSIEAQTEINSLITSMKANLGMEEEWLNFQSRFNAINQNFISHLAHTVPSLTATELNIVSMLRLQVHPKDIARIKHTTLSNIQNHIVRVRKKLGISRSVNLMKYLLSM